ncbi:uncharacterized protein LOC111100080 isoform X2 [Crassostrea virginica]
MKDREVDDLKTYEQLQRDQNIEKQLPVNARKNENRVTSSITPLHDQPSVGTKREYSEYTNTLFTE